MSVNIVDTGTMATVAKNHTLDERSLMLYSQNSYEARDERVHVN